MSPLHRVSHWSFVQHKKMANPLYAFYISIQLRDVWPSTFCSHIHVPLKVSFESFHQHFGDCLTLCHFQGQNFSLFNTILQHFWSTPAKRMTSPSVNMIKMPEPNRATCEAVNSSPQDMTTTKNSLVLHSLLKVSVSANYHLRADVVADQQYRTACPWLNVPAK